MASSAARALFRNCCKYGLNRNTNSGKSSIGIRSVHSSHHESVCLTLALPDGRKYRIKGNVGESLLDSLKNNKVDVEGFGLCDGGAACSTCHVIFNTDDLHRLPPMEDIEADVLELTYNCTDMSRLGCQILLVPELEGVEVKVPDFRVDIREIESCSSIQTDS